VAAVQIALLRAVNLGPHNRVPMAALRELANDLGLTNARTLLNSGNIVFEGGRRSPAAVAQLLEAETARRLGVRTDFMVRRAAEWQALIEANPFPDVAKREPNRLLVICLKAAPDARTARAFEQAVRAGREQVRIAGAQAYIVYPDGVGRSTLTMTAIEKALGTRGTGRNWRTVLKLAALADADGYKPARRDVT
jgi:uncharacterized protein (DUF1697 family)